MAQVPGTTHRASDNAWAPAALQQGGGQVAHNVGRATAWEKRESLQHWARSHTRTIPQEICSPHTVPRRASQKASSQVMTKITGTESNVATKIVSRAKITPRS